MMHVVRIPLLLVLLLAAGPLLPRYTQSRYQLTRIQSDPLGALAPWLLLALIAAVFAVVLLAGRSRGTPRGLAVLEIVLAVLLTLVPPIVWAQVLGPGLVADALGATSPTAFPQVLAVVWLVVAVRALRTPPSTVEPSPDG